VAVAKYKTRMRRFFECRDNPRNLLRIPQIIVPQEGNELSLCRRESQINRCTFATVCAIRMVQNPDSGLIALQDLPGVIRGSVIDGDDFQRLVILRKRTV
jgi:hypothetical protein